MISGLIGKKLGMTRIFDDKGNVIPVTLLEVGPCTVVQVKSSSGKDGYGAVQLGFEPKKLEKVNKPYAGHFKKAGIKTAFRHLCEFRTAKEEALAVGDELTAEQVFKENTIVKVQGTSIGRGFAGGMKRHGFHGSPSSHGAEKVHRRPMSAGSTDAQRVFKGKRSPGHMGDQSVTIRNLKLVKIKALDAGVEEPEELKNIPAQETAEAQGAETAPEGKEKKKSEVAKAKGRKYVVAVKGAIPGKKNSLVIIENL